MKIFDIVKQLCEDRNVKISVLERDLGFSRGSIYKMESSAPSSDKLVKLADYFSVSIDYLVGRTNNKEGFINKDEIEQSYESLLRIYSNCKNKLSPEEKLMFAQNILSDINK